MQPMKSTKQMSNFEKDKENSDENNFINAKHNKPNWPLISDIELHVVNITPCC
jgi:hypothetical protein